VKSGTIRLCILLDTNVILDFLKGENNAIDLSSLFLQYECFASVIVKLELLKYPNITSDEEYTINEFLKLLTIIPINEAIENETIAISRLSKLKLPDAIIGATAIVYDAELVTRDPHFIECKYEKLHIWYPT
jgi:predicted nucleic acid-binding protein